MYPGIHPNTHIIPYVTMLSTSYSYFKCGIAPSGKFLSLYSTSYKNYTRLPDVFNYLLYVTWELPMVLLGNSYHTNIMLVSRLF